MHRALDASRYLSRIPVQSQAHADAATKCNSSIFLHKFKQAQCSVICPKYRNI